MTAPRRAIGSEQTKILAALDQSLDNISRPRGSRPNAHLQPQYQVIVDANRRYVAVSESFCKLLGYQRQELIGKKYDEFTVPGTTDIPVVFELFVNAGYMHGIWVLAHRSGTHLLVRYEAWQRSDGLIEGRMELLGAGA
jgi:PAS domain S-box-containing protein